MIDIRVSDETAPLEAVVLGIAESPGATPKPQEAYDPKSLEHILAGTYPVEEDMVSEMDAFFQVFQKHKVQVFRPRNIPDCNQLFSRDVGFVVDEFFIKSNILPERYQELQAIEYLIEQMNPDRVIKPPGKVHIEGGDVMLWEDYLFVGTYKGDDYPDQITARTNMKGVEFLREFFPKRKVKEFDLVKSRVDARENALHLDCCFQPVGRTKGIIYEGGFRDPRDYRFLVDLFGEGNLFHISKEEMYQMFSNVFSIAPEVVVSEKKFTRLNTWLKANGFTVEEIPYAEIAKQEGLLRCSTLPLKRKYD